MTEMTNFYLKEELKMNKAELYKCSNPHRDIDNVVVDFGGFVDYYNAFSDGEIQRDGKSKIKKKKINLHHRADKISFMSGK